MSMYRNDPVAELDFEAELRAVPSPRRESTAKVQASLVIVVLWLVGCGLWYLLYSRHRVKAPDDTPEILVIGLTAIIPALFAPVLPLGSIVRLLLARRRRGSVKIGLVESGMRWTSHTMRRGEIDDIDCSLSARIGSRPCVIAAAEGIDPPFSLHVPDESTAQRVCDALKAGKSRLGKFVFPVWPAGEVRSNQLLKRASLALFCAGFAAFYGLIAVIEPWLLYFVFFILGPIAFVAGVYFLLTSWGALVGVRPSQALAIDALQVSLDGVLLCLLTDQVSLRIVQEKSVDVEDVLEIISSRTPEGKCLIKPWERGDLHELEMIKATIEAYRADLPGVSRGASSS